MATKTISTLEVLKDIYECVKSSKYKDTITIEYLGTEDDIPGLKIISNKILSIDEMEEIMDIIYDCTDKHDPNLTIHFEWETS